MSTYNDKFSKAVARRIKSSGFYPFPETEDIFAFPTVEKKEAGTLIAVTASLIFPGEEGLLTFFDDEVEFVRKHGRLFTREELDYFGSLPEDARSRLISFWKYSSSSLPKTGEELDNYYSTLYQIKGGADIRLTAGDTAATKENWDPIWQMIVEDTEKENPEVNAWLQANKAMLYWRYFWAEHCRGDIPYWYGDLEEIYRKEIKDILEINQKREAALLNAEEISLGGAPRWFQGLDMTPQAPSGGQMEFAGQFWTDLLGIHGAKLVYLFYDRESGLLKQLYDYD